MSAGAGTSLYPLRRCKVIHLVRHAQGIHNLQQVAHLKTSPQLFDAQLSPLGWKQIDNLREHVLSHGLLKRIQLVIVSPLQRTMQTAVGVFGGETIEEGTAEIPLMVAEANDRGRGAVSSLNRPPFIAVELCRERIGVNTGDKRDRVSKYKTLFPAIDFSLIESDEDTWWTPHVRESDEDLAARGINFFNWLWTREEEEIAIVTHSAFLFQTLKMFGDDCHESVKSEMQEIFQNCELRSMLLVDTRRTGTSCANTNYPGGNPVGPDQPSDAAATKGL